MEVLLDDDVIQEVDVAGSDTEWRAVSLNFTRFPEMPKCRQEDSPAAPAPNRGHAR
jgi:hypothetical protein